MVLSAQTISLPVDLLLSGLAWAVPGTPTTVSYDFPGKVPSTLLAVVPGDPKEDVGWVPMNAAQQDIVRQAMSVISTVANLNFVSSNNEATAEILFGTNNQNIDDSTAYTTYGPVSNLPNGALRMSQDHVEFSNNQYIENTQDYYMAIALHEIANATGLKDLINDSAVPALQNHLFYSVESWFQADNLDIYLYGTPGNVQPVTPQVLDILAWQYLYGANQSGYTPSTPGTVESHVGNDHTYKFSNATAPMTVWIGANVSGINCFDFSSCPRFVTIDLTPGSMSGTDQYQQYDPKTNSFLPEKYPFQNIGIAYGTHIQVGIANWTGATLYADATDKHDNLLIGGIGADTFVAGNGTDIFVGKGGGDTAEFHDAYASYKIISGSNGGMVLIDQAAKPVDGTVMLSSGFTTLEFADKSISLTSTSTSPASSAIVDQAADLQSRLDTLQAYVADGYVNRIELTDSGVPILSVSAGQTISDAKALASIVSPFSLQVSLTHAAADVNGPGGGVATTVSLADPASAYSISTTTGGGIDLAEGSVVDHLTNVDALRFSDATIFLASQVAITPGGVSSAQIADLYAAVFARTPDASGLAYYQQSAISNPTLNIVGYAANFLSSPEYVQNPAHNYAQNAAGDSQFLNDTYQNLLNRMPEAGAVSWYQANVVAPLLRGLTPGTSAYAAAELQAHATILADFSLSAEFFGAVTVSALHPADAHHWLFLAS